ncbi:MFS transporter [Pseudoclavibacter sp. 13-3]|uniref:MFS transporter n=1 Tax=Pseudoclavibacter sp. 13-3 TaxID=2901228 RepID=UPI001E3B56DB|nr:MFS transporter [Pseudoclavibacter sp. 13-3]MCD7101846.1 MFS transporter [Pseudoclavibacter sp. 13-3]
MTAAAQQAAAPQHDDLAARKYERRAIFSSALGHSLDGLDLLILGFAMSGIISTFGVSQTVAGSLTTITLFGALVGGLLFGVLSDRLGRVKVLTYSVIFFAVFTGLTALAPNFEMVAVFRFLAGVGIGAEFGIGMTLAAEAARPGHRARATSWVGIGFQCGVLVAALTSAPIIGAFGWRGLFAVGVIPAVIAIVIRLTLPESRVFLENAGKAQQEPGKTSSRILALFANRRIATTSIAMIILTTVQNFGYFGIMTWLPSYLSKQRELSLTSTGVWTAVTVLGMMLGIVVFGQIADRIGRRPAFWIFQVGAAVSVLVYSQLTTETSLLIGGFVMGMFANGMLGGYGALLAELYPTRIRATAQNVLYNTGRFIGGGLGPIVIAALATDHGFAYALALLPAIYLIAFVTMFLIPDKKGKELDHA